MDYEQSRSQDDFQIEPGLERPITVAEHDSYLAEGSE